MQKYSEKYLEKIDWVKVQNFYDNDKTWRDLISEFNFHNNLIIYAIKIGLLKIRTRSESCKLSRKKNKQVHSQETKDKISRARKEYLKNNPDKVPYLLNHSRKESYPEKYFTELFKKENIDVVKYYRVGLYELDFCIPDKLIDIEIDGNQHYYDKKIIESDIRRNKILEENGWDIIRINWSEYQKLNLDDKKIFISKLKNYIDGLLESKPIIKYIDSRILCECGGKKYRDSLFCVKCNGLKSRRVDRPKYEILIKEIKELGYEGTGRKYGITGNAIKKWKINYEKEVDPAGLEPAVFV